MDDAAETAGAVAGVGEAASAFGEAALGEAAVGEAALAEAAIGEAAPGEAALWEATCNGTVLAEAAGAWLCTDVDCEFCRDVGIA